MSAFIAVVLVLFVLLVIVLLGSRKNRCYSTDNTAFQAGFDQAFQPSLPRVDQFDLSFQIGTPLF
ncbi:hypothetical protein [Chengkuizengella axinellae]|uniref:Uncharacterized protein n=1 Tax=Chengkuizengella axinellae TaxID=3064388 RepID=A0ABT9IV64_9BACL|nr:hypothetical protein [Chengkuizengella sp. 2205SS18-9]MDP5273228.1 hypothetical protein [Chengkuizengella sp. 2205SS18-9]